MFFDFCDSVCSNCLHPFSCLSHTFHSSPPLAISHPSPPSVSLSQTLLITWQWMTSPSRSSCWPLAWPLPESEASPHLRLRCGAAAWSRRSSPCLLCSCSVATDHCTLPSRLWNVTNFLKVPVPDVKFSGSLNEAWRSKKKKKKKKCHISLYLSQQEAVLFDSKPLDVLKKPIKAHQINPWHRVNKKNMHSGSLPLWLLQLFMPFCFTSSLLLYWLLYQNKVTGASRR